MKKSSSLSAKVSLKKTSSSSAKVSTGKKSKEGPIVNAQKTLQQKAPRAQVGLTLKQTQELEVKLKTLKGEIKAALEGKADVFNYHATNESLIKGDDAEVAEKQRMSSAALQEMDMLKNRMILIDRALKKIELGSYGICEETEEPIGFERLLIVPWARYGVKVQEMRERRLRDFKVNRLSVEF
jgi:DnaK suppressor protein